MRRIISTIINIAYIFALIWMIVNCAIVLSNSNIYAEALGFRHAFWWIAMYAIVTFAFWWDLLMKIIKSWKDEPKDTHKDAHLPQTTANPPIPEVKPPADRENPPYTRREWYQIGYKDGYSTGVADIMDKKINIVDDEKPV